MSKLEIQDADQIENELSDVEAIDQATDPKVSDKLLETVFQPVIGSSQQICIHQSRSITCG